MPRKYGPNYAKRGKDGKRAKFYEASVQINILGKRAKLVLVCTMELSYNVINISSIVTTNRLLWMGHVFNRNLKQWIYNGKHARNWFGLKWS